MYDGQPYPEAKEWLVPANLMMLYNHYLTKLPLVDYRSTIVKPTFMLQDYFVSKWKEKLPDDDAEKYLDWYVFYFSTQIHPNVNKTILYRQGVYSFQEVREILDNSWYTIEKINKYEAKGKRFNQIRYAAFQRLSFIYVENAMAYWYDEMKASIDIEAMKKGHLKLKRFIDLYKWIIEMDSYYKTKYPLIYERVDEGEIFYLKRDFTLSQWILNLLYDTEEYKNTKDYCNKNKNPYLNTYLSTKKKLIELEKKGENIGKVYLDFTDEHLYKICKNRLHPRGEWHLLKEKKTINITK